MSDNELDAELLALAGDDSESENEDQKPVIASKSPSPVPSPAAAATKPRPVPRTQKSVVSKKAGKATRTVKQRPRDDSDEDGQAYVTCYGIHPAFHAL